MKIRISLFFLLFLSLSYAAKGQGKDILRQWKAGAVVSENEISSFSQDSCFLSLPLSDETWARMQEKSYKKGCTIPRRNLRYLRILHRNGEGKPQLGEMVCDRQIATILLKIFQELYKNGYRIERMVLVDNYDGSDEKSMKANNTSCFNYRSVNGSRVLSKHSRGLAVDVNPFYNPCIRLQTGKVEPAGAEAYTRNRKAIKNSPYPIIDTNDLCYKLFHENGFVWGGAWKNVKDYQHFEYNR